MKILKLFCVTLPTILLVRLSPAIIFCSVLCFVITSGMLYFAVGWRIAINLPLRKGLTWAKARMLWSCRTCSSCLPVQRAASKCREVVLWKGGASDRGNRRDRVRAAGRHRYEFQRLRMEWRNNTQTENVDKENRVTWRRRKQRGTREEKTRRSKRDSKKMEKEGRELRRRETE